MSHEKHWAHFPLLDYRYELFKEYIHFWLCHVLCSHYSQLDIEEPKRYRYRYWFIQLIINGCNIQI